MDLNVLWHRQDHRHSQNIIIMIIMEVAAVTAIIIIIIIVIIIIIIIIVIIIIIIISIIMIISIVIVNLILEAISSALFQPRPRRVLRPKSNISQVLYCADAEIFATGTRYFKATALMAADAISPEFDPLIPPDSEFEVRVNDHAGRYMVSRVPLALGSWFLVEAMDMRSNQGWGWGGKAEDKLQTEDPKPEDPKPGWVDWAAVAEKAKATGMSMKDAAVGMGVYAKETAEDWDIPWNDIAEQAKQYGDTVKDAASKVEWEKWAAQAKQYGDNVKDAASKVEWDKWAAKASEWGEYAAGLGGGLDGPEQPQPEGGRGNPGGSGHADTFPTQAKPSQNANPGFPGLGGGKQGNAAGFGMDMNAGTDFGGNPNPAFGGGAGGFGFPDTQGDASAGGMLPGFDMGNVQAEFEIEDEAPRRRRLLEPSSIGQGYLFLDWFAIPQITARAEGVNEEATKTDAARAVQSIPFYVEVSDVLLALVPELVHTETGQYCNYTSWFSRGWCRAELWCHVLSNKRDKSVVVVHSTLEAKFMQSWDWQNNIVVDGEFTVESDRAVVGSLGRRAIESKIAHLSEEGPLEVYRYFLARQAAMLGQASKAWDMNGFLERFKFPSMELAVRDTSSMNAVMCAVMSGDVMMLRLLATYAADLNFTIYGLNSLGFRDSFTVLMAAVKSNQPASLVASLIHLRADVSRRADIGDNAACHVKRPEHVQVLLQARADFHTAHEPFCFTPLAQAAGMTSAPTLKALLLARCDPNPSQSGLGITPLIGLIRFARGSPHALESAALLLEYRADINASQMKF
ncbi:unnamed protein product [Symbiodinium microadriaticum]|nr:unnamed protein product [Symbiodinium microadriaticum]